MKPDLDAIRARWVTCLSDGEDTPTLLAYIDELEREIAELKARIVVLEGMKP